MESAGEEMTAYIFAHSNYVHVSDKEVITAAYYTHTHNLSGLCLFVSCLLQCHLCAMWKTYCLDDPSNINIDVSGKRTIYRAIT